MSKHNRIPAEIFPPGEIIDDELKIHGMTRDELAEMIDMDADGVESLVRGETRIGLDLAIRLEYALGVSAVFWMNQEMAYRRRDRP